jgi:MFS superfamily sulfate permease-like transporter
VFICFALTVFALAVFAFLVGVFTGVVLGCGGHVVDSRWMAQRDARELEDRRIARGVR